MPATPHDFLSALPPFGRLLGFDVGEKTIGLAISDGLRNIASPFMTLKKARWYVNATEIEAVIEQELIAGLVIGLPLNMDGTIGPRAQSVKQFANNAENAFGLPVVLQDERMSTLAVEKAMLEADLSRQKRKKQVDKLAATYILQLFLDRLR